MALRRVGRRLQGGAKTTTPLTERYTVPPYKPPEKTDLVPTVVHRGTGTGPHDPVNRMTPNQVSRPAASVALNPTMGWTAAQSATDVSCIRPETPLTLGQWLAPIATSAGGPNAAQSALGIVVEQLKTPNPLPLSRNAQALLDKFQRTTLPDLLKRLRPDVAPDATLAATQAQTMLERLGQADHLLDRAKFDASSAAAATAVLKFFRNGIANEDTEDAPEMKVLEDVVEVLRRDAVLKRNHALDELRRLVERPTHRHGQVVWERFFQSVDSMKSALMGEDDALLAQYEVSSSNQAEPPAMRAAVALLFVVVSSAQSAAVASAAATPPASSSTTLDELAVHLPTSVLQEFAAPRLAGVLSSSSGSSSSVKEVRLDLLRSLGVSTELIRQLSIVRATEGSRAAWRHKRAEEIAPVFSSLEDSAKIITGILRRDVINDAAAIKHTLRLLGATAAALDEHGNLVRKKIPSGGDVKAMLSKMNWTTTHRSVMTALLTHPATVRAAAEDLQAEARAKEQAAALSKETRQFLLETVSQDEAQRTAAIDTLRDLQLQLLEGLRPPQLLALLDAANVDLAPLRRAAAERASDACTDVACIPTTTALYPLLIREVASQKPSWIKQGVINPETDAKFVPSSAPALRVLLKLYLRMSYVPATGAALLANRYRGRIGPVAKTPDQTNLEVEVGFAEHYDIEQYKRFDWQGWYQRMSDVYNRNVSIRCKLSNLRKLDHYGRPFIDMQTERRLRVVSGERVGNSVVKLDTDRYEDQKDNLEFGTTKLQELLSEAKKAQLGEEYWPSVEVKVRKASGQSKMLYSTLDWDRVEAESKASFEAYKKKKASALYVPPMDTWLKMSGATVASAKIEVSGDGYVDALSDSLSDDAENKKGGPPTSTPTPDSK